MTEEKSPRHLTRCLLAGAAILLSATLAQADPAEQFKLPAGAQIGNYVGEDVYIPMRDGVKLHAEVWRPRDAQGPLPILMQRSRFILQGVLRPFLVVAPSFFLYPFWRKLTMLPAEPGVLSIWAVVTATIAWWIVLTTEDRRELRAFLHRLLYWRVDSPR